MKKFLLILSIFSSGVAFSQTKVYPGNGNNSFGGAIGLGNLSITDSGDSVSFRLNRGTGLFDSLLVFYIDDPKVTTGISTTSGLTPFGATADKYLVAATGRNAAGQEAILNFPANFRPDLAVVFDKDAGKVFALASSPFGSIIQDRGTFTVTPSGTSSAPSYVQKSSKADYGVAANDTLNFNFMGTYIGQTASRSNEGIGDPFTNYLRVGSYNSYTVQSFFNYSTREAALPVSVVDLKATGEQGKVKINWTVAQETNIDGYDVQRSSNGVQFSTISSVQAKNSSNPTSYSAYDVTPPRGTNYYRLIIKERGKTEISKVVSVKNGSAKNSLVVYQSGSKLNVKMSGLTAGVYSLSVVNGNAQLLQNSTIQHDGVDVTKQVELKSNIAKGIYRVVLQSGAEKLTESVILQ